MNEVILFVIGIAMVFAAGAMIQHVVMTWKTAGAPAQYQHDYIVLTVREVNNPDAEHNGYWFDPNTDWFTTTIARTDIESISTQYCRDAYMDAPFLVLKNQATSTGKKALLLADHQSATQCYEFLSTGFILTISEIEEDEHPIVWD